MRTRSVVAAGLLIQGLALGVWTIAQLLVLRDLIHDASQPGAENYATSLVISGAFALVLTTATVVTVAILLRDLLDLNLLVRLEVGVIALVVITVIANQWLISVPMLVALGVAIAVVTVALRTRLL